MIVDAQVSQPERTPGRVFGNRPEPSSLLGHPRSYPEGAPYSNPTSAETERGVREERDGEPGGVAVPRRARDGELADEDGRGWGADQSKKADGKACGEPGWLRLRPM